MDQPRERPPETNAYPLRDLKKSEKKNLPYENLFQPYPLRVLRY
jgi:hypothetical protein